MPTNGQQDSSSRMTGEMSSFQAGAVESESISESASTADSESSSE
ncbi:hypothetical protein [Candidatus Lucifugimonas marina]